MSWLASVAAVGCPIVIGFKTESLWKVQLKRGRSNLHEFQRRRSRRCRSAQPTPPVATAMGAPFSSTSHGTQQLITPVIIVAVDVHTQASAPTTSIRCVSHLSSSSQPQALWPSSAEELRSTSRQFSLRSQKPCKTATFVLSFPTNNTTTGTGLRHGSLKVVSKKPYTTT